MSVLFSEKSLRDKILHTVERHGSGGISTPALLAFLGEYAAEREKNAARDLIVEMLGLGELGTGNHFHLVLQEKR